MRELGKIFSFHSAHKLPYHEGLCQKLHGHNYKLEVRVVGKVKEDNTGPDSGMIIDFGELKNVVNFVINSHDHILLNNLYFNPTAEIMVEKIAEDIQSRLPPDIQVSMIKLWETEDSYAIWRNEDL